MTFPEASCIPSQPLYCVYDNEVFRLSIAMLKFDLNTIYMHRRHFTLYLLDSLANCVAVIMYIHIHFQVVWSTEERVLWPSQEGLEVISFGQASS